MLLAMLLAIDIGNTCVDLGLFVDGDLVRHQKYRSGPPDDTKLSRLLAPLAPPLIGVAIGSVVAELGEAYETACRAHTRGPVLQIQGSWDWGLQIDYDDPNHVGVDRLAAATAAHEMAAAGQAAIIADAGTALTVDAVDAKGVFRGGAIAPGLHLGLNALSAGTSLLPQIELDPTAPLLGKNTAAGLRSGALHGSAALVEGLCARMAAELDEPTAVFLTGGDSPLLHPHIPGVDTCDPALVLRGLALAYNRRTS